MPAALLYVTSIGLVLSLGCANQKKIVPAENQKKAEERYGQQQQSMQGLNQTPGEQAAAAHEDATRPVEPVGDDN